MFLSRNKKTNIYPCKHQFYYIKVGFKGVKLHRRVFVMIWAFAVLICPKKQIGMARHKLIELRHTKRALIAFANASTQNEGSRGGCGQGGGGGGGG